MASSSRPSRSRVLSTSPFTREVVPPPTTDGFSVGDRVTLDRIGMGRVTEVDANFVTVDFGSVGVRRVPAGAKGFTRL